MKARRFRLEWMVLGAFLVSACNSEEGSNPRLQDPDGRSNPQDSGSSSDVLPKDLIQKISQAQGNACSYIINYDPNPSSETDFSGFSISEPPTCYQGSVRDPEAILESIISDLGCSESERLNGLCDASEKLAAVYLRLAENAEVNDVCCLTPWAVVESCGDEVAIARSSSGQLERLPNFEELETCANADKDDLLDFYLDHEELLCDCSNGGGGGGSSNPGFECFDESQPIEKFHNGDGWYKMQAEAFRTGAGLPPAFIEAWDPEFWPPVPGSDLWESLQRLDHYDFRSELQLNRDSDGRRREGRFQIVFETEGLYGMNGFNIFDPGTINSRACYSVYDSSLTQTEDPNFLTKEIQLEFQCAGFGPLPNPGEVCLRASEIPPPTGDFGLATMVIGPHRYLTGFVFGSSDNTFAKGWLLDQWIGSRYVPYGSNKENTLRQMKESFGPAAAEDFQAWIFTR